MKRLIRGCLLLIGMMSSFSSLAAADSGQFDIFAAFGSLIFVVAFILFLAWLMKRMRIPALGREKDFAVIRQIPLGARERLMVVKAGEEQFVVGMTPQSIQLISKLETPLTDHSENIPDNTFSSSFAKQLNQLLKKNEKD